MNELERRKIAYAIRGKVDWVVVVGGLIGTFLRWATMVAIAVFIYKWIMHK